MDAWGGVSITGCDDTGSNKLLLGWTETRVSRQDKLITARDTHVEVFPGSFSSSSSSGTKFFFFCFPPLLGMAEVERDEFFEFLGTQSGGDCGFVVNRTGGLR
jgi:hypothetical protein